MSKPKRYENLQNAVNSTSALQNVAKSSSTNKSEAFVHQKRNQKLCQQQLPSFIQPTPQPTPFIQDTTQLNPPVQITMQSISPIQATSQSKTPMKPPKKYGGRESMQYWTVNAIDSQGNIKKLKVKKRDALNLSNGERIIVDFDDMDSPIGEGQAILARFCGILATDCSIFPILFEKWSDLPATYVNRCFDQFIKKAETGKTPGRGQLYLATHKNEDGTYVNEAAKEICEKIELAMTQSITDESKISPNDVVGKFLGKEHSGRVRCLGLGFVPSRAFEQTRPRIVV